MNAKRQYPYKGNDKDDQDVDKKKLKYDLPEDNKSEVLECICYLPSKGYVCRRCHHYFFARIAERCPIHPLGVFQLDYYYCPLCSTPMTNDQESKPELPSDDDDDDDM